MNMLDIDINYLNQIRQEHKKIINWKGQLENSNIYLGSHIKNKKIGDKFQPYHVATGDMSTIEKYISKSHTNKAESLKTMWNMMNSIGLFGCYYFDKKNLIKFF